MPRGEIIDNWVGRRVLILGDDGDEADCDLIGVCAKGVVTRRDTGGFFTLWGEITYIKRLDEPVRPRNDISF
jgi:hypothetical protein